MEEKEMHEPQTIEPERNDPQYGNGVYLYMETEKSAPIRVAAQLFVPNEAIQQCQGDPRFWRDRREEVKKMFIHEITKGLFKKGTDEVYKD